METEEAIYDAGEMILDRLQCKGLLMTLGEDGMCLFEREASQMAMGRIRQTRIPTVAQDVFDVAGAGDTVIAVFTTALASGFSMVEAAQLANYAAGIVVGKVGVGVATAQELQEQMRAHPKQNPSRKPAASSANERR